MSPRPDEPKTTLPGERHPAERQPVDGESGAETSRLCLISLKVDAALRREIDAYAEAHGITRSRAANHYLAIARETIREREGVPSGKADELMEAVDGLRAVMDILGPPTFGMLRLLVHWSTQAGGVKVNEDKLLAELRTVGADEWEQAVAEAERDLHETSGATGQKRRKALVQDARGLRNLVYFRFILTVDNRTAERFGRLDGRLAERVLRDSVAKPSAARPAESRASSRSTSTAVRNARRILTSTLFSALGFRTSRSSRGRPEVLSEAG